MCFNTLWFHDLYSRAFLRYTVALILYVRLKFCTSMHVLWNFHSFSIYPHSSTDKLQVNVLDKQRTTRFCTGTERPLLKIVTSSLRAGTPRGVFFLKKFRLGEILKREYRGPTIFDFPLSRFRGGGANVQFRFPPPEKPSHTKATTMDTTAIGKRAAPRGSLATYGNQKHQAK